MTQLSILLELVYGKESRSVEFTQVLHVPQLRNNLLSCLYLTKHKGFKLHVDESTMHFKRAGQTLFTATVTFQHTGILNGDDGESYDYWPLCLQANQSQNHSGEWRNLIERNKHLHFQQIQ